MQLKGLPNEHKFSDMNDLHPQRIHNDVAKHVLQIAISVNIKRVLLQWDKPTHANADKLLKAQ